MKSILLIQFRKNLERIMIEQRRFSQLLPEGCSIDFLSIFDVTDSHMLRDTTRTYDAVMFGGSSEFDIDGERCDDDVAKCESLRFLELIRDTVEDIIATNQHFFGVCFGHQLVAELRNGKVRRDHTQCKDGTHTVLMLQDGRDDPLLCDTPEVFYAQYGHKDSVTTLPYGATILAASPTCNFAVLRYNTNVYTTQFHPEIEMSDMLHPADYVDNYLPTPSGDFPLHESPHATALLVAFYKKVSK